MSATFPFCISDALALLPLGAGTPANLAQWFGTSRRELRIPTLTLKKRGLIQAEGDALTATPAAIDVAAAKVHISDEGEVGRVYVHVVQPTFPVIGTGSDQKIRSIRKSAAPVWQFHVIKKTAEPDFTARRFFAHLEHTIEAAELPREFAPGPGMDMAALAAAVATKLPAGLEWDAITANGYLSGNMKPGESFLADQETCAAFMGRWIVANPWFAYSK